MIQWPATEGLGASVSFLSILVCRASAFRLRASGFRVQDFGPRSNSRRHGCLISGAGVERLSYRRIQLRRSKSAKKIAWGHCL